MKGIIVRLTKPQAYVIVKCLQLFLAGDLPSTQSRAFVQRIIKKIVDAVQLDI